MGLEDIQARQQAERDATAAALKEGKNPFRSRAKGPRVFEDRGIYVVAWDDPEQIELDFDLLHTDRQGNTSAEVTIYTTGVADTRLLHRTRLNLLSTISQGHLAKYLTPRTKHLSLDWVEMLAEACQQVLTLHRKGEPAILLRDAPMPPHGASLLPPLLADAGPTILFGDGGTGKSTIALALAASLHTGSTFVAGLSPTGAKRVGYCDWESSDYVHRQRLERLWGGADLPDLVYVPCRASLAEERDRLRRIVHEHNLEFLVLDSVAYAAGGEPESAETAMAFFAALRVLDVPSLCVAHVTNAAAKTSADRPFGSAFWHNSARATWYVKKAEGSGQTQMMLGLYNRKTNDGPIAQPIGMRIAFNGDLTVIHRANVREEVDLDAIRPLRYRIADELRDGPSTVALLSERLDSDEDTIRKALRRAEGKQFIKVVRDGMNQWGLVQTHD